MISDHVRVPSEGGESAVQAPEINVPPIQGQNDNFDRDQLR